MFSATKPCGAHQGAARNYARFMDNLSERNSTILRAIVEDYISTAEPVGSKAIATKYNLALSPATIRSVMAELEAEGFLYQPHTSAGRVPTDKSFRFFIDSLLEFEPPQSMETEYIRRIFDKSHSVEAMLTETARALSSITNCAGLMFIPRKDRFVIKHLSLFKLDETHVMVIFVSRLGMARTRQVRLGPVLGKLNLERVSNYLNSIGAGLTITGLRARVVEEMKKEKNLYDELLAGALKLGAMALQTEDASDEKDLYLEGRVNIIDQPEFRDDFNRMKKIFAAFEEKSLLVKILDEAIDESGIQIYLGSEGKVEEFEGLSFVTAPYGSEGLFGTLGVIGPVRMNYPRIIPLVEYTAGLLSSAL